MFFARGAFFAAEVHGVFVGVHVLGALFAGEFDFGALGAEFGAGWKIGQALEGEELGGGVAAGADGFHGFEKDGVVDFFGGGVLAAGPLSPAVIWSKAVRVSFWPAARWA